MKTAFAAMLLFAAFVATPATAHADCGDPGQPPCTGSVPTVDQVTDVMNALFDPNIPALNKTNVVTPGFTPEEAATIDDHLHSMDNVGLLPLGWNVTNIQPAPANFAGATIASTGRWWTQNGAPDPNVFVDQGGHWLITHDSAWTALDNTWYNVNRRRPHTGQAN